VNRVRDANFGGGGEANIRRHPNEHSYNMKGEGIGSSQNVMRRGEGDRTDFLAMAPEHPEKLAKEEKKESLRKVRADPLMPEVQKQLENLLPDSVVSMQGRKRPKRDAIAGRRLFF